MKTNEELLQEILARLDTLNYIKPEKIPDIDLYMDQVTTFMDENLKKTKRNAEDKVLTKTMINNYAKNNLLPPPLKKKYSREHILLLIFIYYYKNLLSINDIEQLFGSITENHFSSDATPSLMEVYQETFSLKEEEMSRLKKDIQHKFDLAQNTFSDSPPDKQEYLQRFAFISELAFDVYLKKQIIESLIDQMRGNEEQTKEHSGRSSYMQKKKK